MEKTNYMNDGIVIKNNDGTEEIIQIPYNLNNILINEKNITDILSMYNVNIGKINHMEYIQNAFVHKSYCKKPFFTDEILSDAKKEMNNPANLLELQEQSYERLEFFGDRVLKICVSMYLFHRYPKQNEGFMTRLQMKIEDKKNLAIMSKDMGLSKYFIISRQIDNMNGRCLDNMHEDIFEALIGAIFLSNGFEPCLFLITNLLETLIDYSDKLYCDNNYKDRLLRYHHQYNWTQPTYIIINQSGLPNKRKYIMGIEKHNVQTDTPLMDRCVGYGCAYSKKEGEQQAAKMALITYGVLNKDQYNSSDIFYPNWEEINNSNELAD
jgi:ribonuclease-3